jgi:hypothetical protein
MDGGFDPDRRLKACEEHPLFERVVDGMSCKTAGWTVRGAQGICHKRSTCAVGRRKPLKSDQVSECLVTLGFARAVICCAINSCLAGHAALATTLCEAQPTTSPTSVARSRPRGRTRTLPAGRRMRGQASSACCDKKAKDFLDLEVRPWVEACSHNEGCDCLRRKREPHTLAMGSISSAGFPEVLGGPADQSRARRT